VIVSNNHIWECKLISTATIFSVALSVVLNIVSTGVSSENAYWLPLGYHRNAPVFYYGLMWYPRWYPLKTTLVATMVATENAVI